MTPAEYWQEAAETALDEMGLFNLVESLTAEQRAEFGQALSVSHEHYSMAFYTPPPSDRIKSIEREYEAKIASLKADAEKYQRTAEQVVARVLRQQPGARITITKDGEVLRFDGRIERIA